MTAGCLLLIALYATKTIAGTCIDWTAASSLHAEQPAKGTTTLLVQPFQDFTKVDGDTWLVLGLRDFVADLLSLAKGLEVQSESPARPQTTATPPDILIEGMFQHFPGRLRLFISVTDGKKGLLIRQLEASFPYPENSAFFSEIASLSTTIAQELGTSMQASLFAARRDATDQPAAYAAFARGRQLLQSADPESIAAAIPLFTAVKRLDYRSPLGYEGIIAALAFEGLRAKQAHEPFVQAFQRAEQELVKMAQLARPPTRIFGMPAGALPAKRRENRSEITNRFFSGNVRYLEGLSRAQAGSWKDAARSLEEAVSLVPEDALAWYQLSRMQSKLGDLSEAKRSLQKAYALNKCIEKDE